MQDALGLSRGLHVLSMMYEHNYEIALHAQNRLGDRIRSVIVPWPRHHRRRTRHPHQGRRGRLSHHLAADQDDRPEDGGAHHRARLVDALSAPRRRARDGRLEAAHPQDARHASCWSTWAASIRPRGSTARASSSCCNASTPAAAGSSFRPRISKQDDFPFSDTDPLVKKLVEHAPNRLLWGSDWPHPQYFKPMPNDVKLLDMMLDWVPDEKTRKLIFVDNPAEVFGFPPV